MIYTKWRDLTCPECGKKWYVYVDGEGKPVPDNCGCEVVREEQDDRVHSGD